MPLRCSLSNTTTNPSRFCLNVSGELSGTAGTMPILPFMKQQLNGMLAKDPVLTGSQSTNLSFEFLNCLRMWARKVSSSSFCRSRNIHPENSNDLLNSNMEVPFRAGIRAQVSFCHAMYCYTSVHGFFLILVFCFCFCFFTLTWVQSSSSSFFF